MAKLEYDPLTGTITENGAVIFPRRMEDGRPMKMIGALGRKFTPRRLAWELHYGYPPPAQLILNDGDEMNIKLSNMRPVSREEISNTQHRLRAPERLKNREEALASKRRSEQDVMEKKSLERTAERLATLHRQMKEGLAAIAEEQRKREEYQERRRTTSVGTLLDQNDYGTTPD